MGGPLTFLQHPHFEAFHEAAGLAGLPPPLGDLTLVGGRAAVLDVPCKETDSVARCPAGPPPTGQTGRGLTGQTYTVHHAEVPTGLWFSKKVL